MTLFKIKSAQIYLFFFVFGLASCKQRQQSAINAIALNLSIARFDLAIDSLSPVNLSEKHQLWQKEYGQFYTDYITHMLQAGNLQDTAELFNNYRKILQSPDFNELKRSTLQTFPNLDAEEQQLTSAFKHVKYYFPAVKIPQIITFFSGFAVQSPINENYIGIGLDMFLGEDSKFYPALAKSIPRYIARRFTRENILPRTMETYLRETLYPEPDFKTPNLLTLMVYNGKIMYLMDEFMPQVADSLKIGYTSNQMQWAKNYEKDIWAWFLEEDLLFETDYYKIQKHVGEAPFTPELGSHNESAPKLGVFLGWQIVKKYMQEHPETTLNELLKQDDAQQLLKESKYKGL